MGSIKHDRNPRNIDVWTVAHFWGLGGLTRESHSFQSTLLLYTHQMYGCLGRHENICVYTLCPLCTYEYMAYLFIICLPWRAGGVRPPPLAPRMQYIKRLSSQVRAARKGGRGSQGKRRLGRFGGSLRGTPRLETPRNQGPQESRCFSSASWSITGPNCRSDISPIERSVR